MDTNARAQLVASVIREAVVERSRLADKVSAGFEAAVDALVEHDQRKLAADRVRVPAGPRCPHVDAERGRCAVQADTDEHTGPHLYLFKCAGASCPGYLWPASSRPHPASCAMPAAPAVAPAADLARATRTIARVNETVGLLQSRIADLAGELRAAVVELDRERRRAAKLEPHLARLRDLIGEEAPGGNFLLGAYDLIATLRDRVVVLEERAAAAERQRDEARAVATAQTWRAAAEQLQLIADYPFDGPPGVAPPEVLRLLRDVAGDFAGIADRALAAANGLNPNDSTSGG